MAEKSPNECLSDPQFVQVLSATLSLEVSNNEKEITETTRQIENSKSVLSSNVKDRKRLKQLFQIEERNKIIFQDTLENLRKIENGRLLELNLLTGKQDDSLLRAHIDQERFLQILETYKETWIIYKAEYEQFPLALERKEEKNVIEKLKVECMIQEYKKNEYEKMLNLRNGIDDLKIQLIVVELSKVVLERWNEQEKIDELINEIHEFQIKWNNLSQQYEEMMVEIEKDAKNKALARLQMPPPNIDFSFMRAVYAESSSKNQFRFREKLYKRFDSDSISVNTVMLEEICRDENTREEENDLIPVDAYEDDENLEISETPVNNEITDSNTETLERVCRQLSITEETLEVSNDNTYDKVPGQTKAQVHFESQPVEINFLNEKINHLKKKATQIDDPLHLNLEAVEKKKPKMDHRVEVFSQVQQDPQSQKLFQKKKSFLNDIQLPTSQPQIRSMETFSQPLNASLPMAEVPPTPSALYSPRLGSNYGSCTNLSLNDSDINWKDFELSRAGSDISFASSSHIYPPNKPPVDNKALKPISKPQDINVNSFFNFFPTSKQTNKRLF